MNLHDAGKAGPEESLFPPARLGSGGEAEAADYLGRDKGFAILERNWRNPDDRREEIDLIARDGAIIVFIEVKTRSAGAVVPGFYAVRGAKRNALRRAARRYLRSLAEPPRTFRFDVVEVEWTASGIPQFRHFPNVPLFLRYERA